MTAEALGTKQINHETSAHREVYSRESEEIINILKAAERPILLHCRNGADRSGLVSAVYVAAIEHGPE